MYYYSSNYETRGVKLLYCISTFNGIVFRFVPSTTAILMIRMMNRKEMSGSKYVI